MTNVLLLASGGLDSTTLAYWLVDQGKKIHALFFDYGQHCAEKEWNTLAGVLPRSVDPPERIDISGLFSGSRSRMIVEADLWREPVVSDDLYIPYRTLLFFSAAAARAQTLGLNKVYSGFINSNHAKELDCSAEFINGLGELAKNVGQIELLCPFRDFSKHDIASLASSLGVPIGKTFSCQVFSDTPCGVCPNCVDRIDGLQSMGGLT